MLTPPPQNQKKKKLQEYHTSDIANPEIKDKGKKNNGQNVLNQHVLQVLKTKQAQGNVEKGVCKSIIL